MLNSLKQKLFPKNQLVEFYQKGLMSENEFDREMKKLNVQENRANEIEKEFHNADIIADEQDEISKEEVMEAEHYSERADRDARHVLEDGCL